MEEKSDKVFRYIRLRMQENFLRTWYSIFQQLSHILVPQFLLLCYIHRYVAYMMVSSEQTLNFDFTSVVKNIQN